MSLVTQGLGPGGAAPLRFLMRAYHTAAPIGYIYWTVENAPDITGALAPYPAIDLQDIVTAYAYPQVTA